jgi:glycerol-1-phosphate dehydrogenase [NAD(P)+]
MIQYGHKQAFIVCDGNTYKAAGSRVKKLLDERNIPNTLYVFKENDLIPNEQAIGELMMALYPEEDLIIGVGTGTINDICKYISFKMRLQYFIVATAPSMDGFASTGAPLITSHLKTTYSTHVPELILGDLDILSSAPMDLITAGLGDILGKYTCLADWRISHIINDEYYCDTIAQMVEASIQKVVNNIENVKSRDPNVVGSIMEALVLTGIAMSYVGNSRPASGSEHHISHFWEMKFLLEGKKPVLHGRKVGIGTVVVSYIYGLLKDITIDFNKATEAVQSFNEKQWEEKIRSAYGAAAPGVIDLEKQAQKNSKSAHAVRIKRIEERWPDIVKVMETVPSVKKIESMLSELGAPINPAQVGVDSQAVIDGILVSKEVRDRYTLLQLLWDLDLSEVMAQKTLVYLQTEQTIL